MENVPHLVEVALMLLVAFLIGCVIGYLLRVVFSKGRDTTDSTAAETAAPAPAMVQEAAVVNQDTAPARTTKPKAAGTAEVKSKAVAPKSSTVKPKAGSPKPASTAPASTDGQPLGLDAPRDGKKDNLKEIKGIGPKIEEKLNGMGIFHVDQIAAWDRKTIKWVDEHLSFKGRIDREKWVPQAKALAKQKS